MRFSNSGNLPAPLVAAVINDNYDGARYDITASSLPVPPRIRELMRRHGEEIIEDVSERIWALIGQVGHAILERAPADNVFREERLEAKMAGWTIGGKVDLLRTAGNHYAIDDYKLVSLWSMKDEKADWTLQLNTYAWLARENGFDITQLRIIGILRDWSKSRAAREPDYPQVGVVVREVPLWPADICRDKIWERIVLHQAARLVDDDELPLCTAEERWRKLYQWAVKVKGNKRALRLFDRHEEAIRFATEVELTSKQRIVIEERAGEDVRCLSYCAVKEICSYGRSLERRQSDGKEEKSQA